MNLIFTQIYIEKFLTYTDFDIIEYYYLDKWIILVYIISTHAAWVLIISEVNYYVKNRQ